MAFVKAEEIRSRSSDAAARVKVTISRRLRSAGLTGSVRRRMIRSVKVAVLPDPAAADRRSVLPIVDIAALCAGVQILSVDMVIIPVPF